MKRFSRAVQVITRLVTEADLPPNKRRKLAAPKGMVSLGKMNLSDLDAATKEATRDGNDQY